MMTDRLTDNDLHELLDANHGTCTQMIHQLVSEVLDLRARCRNMQANINDLVAHINYDRKDKR